MSAATEATAVPQVETKGGVVAYLAVNGAVRAAAFYVKAFGATIAAQHPVDGQGRTMHIHIHLNGSSVMLGDGYPEEGHPALPPQGFNLMLPVTGIEAWWDRAIAAGCTGVMAPQKMFWGDTYAQVSDPFGFAWSLNQAA